MANEIHANDIGTELRVTVLDDGVAVDLANATSMQMLLKKPSGATETFTASFYTDGSDGIITYTTVSGDIDEVGVYKIQGLVVIEGGTFYTSVGSFKVYCNIG